MKFPSALGICTVRGDQLAARECYSIAMKGKSQPGQQAMVINEGGEKSQVMEVTHGMEEPQEGNIKVAQQDDIDP